MNTIFSKFCAIILVSFLLIGSVSTIRNGTVAKIGEFSFMAAVMNKTNNLLCGGIIINLENILAVATCLKIKSSTNITKPEDVYIIAGDTSYKSNGQTNIGTRQERGVKKIVLHPDESGALPLIHDIVILKLKKPLTENCGTHPVSITTEETQKGHECIIAGWGSISEKKNFVSPFRYARVRIIDNPDENMREYGDQIACAQGIQGGAICFGDTGSPLLCGEELLGITSLIYATCMENQFFQVLKFETQWINSIVEWNGEGNNPVKRSMFEYHAQAGSRYFLGSSVEFLISILICKIIV